MFNSNYTLFSKCNIISFEGMSPLEMKIFKLCVLKNQRITDAN